MGTLDRIQALADEGKRVEAGVMLVRGVTAHDPDDPLRQGYSLGSALLMADRLLTLTVTETALIADRIMTPLIKAAQDFRDTVEVSAQPDEDDIEDFSRVLIDYGVAP